MLTQYIAFVSIFFSFLIRRKVEKVPTFRGSTFSAATSEMLRNKHHCACGEIFFIFCRNVTRRDIFCLKEIRLEVSYSSLKLQSFDNLTILPIALIGRTKDRRISFREQSRCRWDDQLDFANQ